MGSPLELWLHQQLGVAVARLGAVGGGCIHRAWCVELADGQRWFAKTNSAPALPLLQAEADGLRALAAVAPPGVVVPLPLASGVAGDQAVLVLPWLDLGGVSGEQGWQQLGRNLAQLHRTSLTTADGLGRFGWGSDNFIGTSRQPNGWCASWAGFFVDQRLGYQLQLAAAGGVAVTGAQRLLEQLRDWLEPHHPEPVLVHGDLWSGNAALLSAGGAALFDPAIYRGDREVDLAMAQLFGGFPAAFFEGYQQEWPLPAGHRQRQDVYNLYHLLNHANLFGGGYRRQVQQSIKALLNATA